MATTQSLHIPLTPVRLPDNLVPSLERFRIPLTALQCLANTRSPNPAFLTPLLDQLFQAHANYQAICLAC